MLEIGCGICTDLLQFARGHAQVVGADLTNKALHLGKKRFVHYGLEGAWLNTDAENLEFKDNTFDYVYSFGVLHHTPDTQKAINEVHRVLKKGGSTTIMLYAKYSYYYIIWILLYQGIIKGELLKHSLSELLNRYTETGDSPLTKAYSKREVKNLFREFTNVRVYKRFWVTRLDRYFPEYVISEFSKIFGWHLIIKANK